MLLLSVLLVTSLLKDSSNVGSHDGPVRLTDCHWETIPAGQRDSNSAFLKSCVGGLEADIAWVIGSPALQQVVDSLSEDVKKAEQAYGIVLAGRETARASVEKAQQALSGAPAEQKAKLEEDLGIATKQASKAAEEVAQSAAALLAAKSALEEARKAFALGGVSTWRLTLAGATLDIPGRVLPSDKRHAYLLAAHDSVKSLRRGAPEGELKSRLTALEETIHEPMNEAGLRQPVVALLTPTLGVNHASSSTSTSPGTAPTAGASSPAETSGPEAVSLRIETREARGFGILASIGREPVLGFKKVDEKPPDATFVTAVVWSFGAKWSYTIQHEGQIGVFGRWGQILGEPNATIVGSGAESKIATMQTAIGPNQFREVGFRGSIFRQNVDPSEARAKPLLEVQVALRKDSRFKGLLDTTSGSGASKTTVSFPTENRWTFRLLCGEIPVLGENFAASVGIEYEMARGNKLSSSTRIFVQGSTDLVKAIFGKGQAAEAGTAGSGPK